MQSLLPAGHALTPQAPGEYYLAVGAYNLDPLGADEPIFGPGTGVVGPTGLGGREPVSGWDGRLGGSGPYMLTLTGARCAAAGHDAAGDRSAQPLRRRGRERRRSRGRGLLVRRRGRL